MTIKTHGRMVTDNSISITQLNVTDGSDGQVLATDGSGTMRFESTAVLVIEDNSVTGAKIALGSDTQGDVMYYDGTNWVRLAKGTAAQTLAMNSGATAPEWVTAAAAVPTGLISMWSGAVSAVPSGWVICDGSNSTPNLTDKFVIHASADSGATYDVGDTGGSTSTGSHVLTVAETPAHTHSYQRADITGVQGPGGAVSVWSGSAIPSRDTSSSGSGGGHTHTASLPPYYALAYIMKT